MSRRRGTVAVVAGLAAGPAVLLLLTVALGGLLATDGAAAGASCGVAVDAPGARVGDPGRLSATQRGNARLIVAVGRDRGVPPYGWTVALAAALAESGLVNLPTGDRDSVGLFQQRPAAGWGSPPRLRDPAYATGRFYDALQRVPNWTGLPVAAAAQAVQRSAYPRAYAAWAPLAATLVRTLTGADPGCPTDPIGPGGPWRSPLPPGGYRVSSPFGPRTDPVRGGTDDHTGIDLAAAPGTPVAAAADGVVAFAGPAGPYGLLVTLQHPGGAQTWYAHLSAIDVVAGVPVRAGDPVGRVGATGNTTGPHLHLEIRIDGKPVDPSWLTGPAPPPPPPTATRPRPRPAT